MSSKPEFTAEDMIEEARARGFTASKRLLHDWVTLGLVDEATRRGLGRGRGTVATWPLEQLNLFLTLLDQRQRKGATHVVALANAPVWIWLTFGDDYVPMRQVRRALATGTGRHRSRKGVSRADARKMARAFVAAVGHPNARPKARAALRDYVEDSLVEESLDPKYFRNVLEPVFDPHGKEPEAGPEGARFSVDNLLLMAEARFEAIRNLDEITDDDLERARLIYLTTKSEYFEDHQRLAADERFGANFDQPSIERDIQRAVIDLLSLLGLGRLRPEGARRLEEQIKAAN